jgi:hypothetical protein
LRRRFSVSLLPSRSFPCTCRTMHHPWLSRSSSNLPSVSIGCKHTLAAQATHRQDARLESCNLSYHDILHSSTPGLCLSVNMRLCHRIRTLWAALFLPALDVLGCTLSDLLKSEKCPHQACHHVPPRARRCSPAHCRYDLLPG